MHLFIRGPQYSYLWLGKAPILDLLSLTACLAGIYYYAVRWQATRSKLLGVMFVIGFILVGIGGPVSLSILVPILYISIAMGIGFILKQWLQVFPINPLARGVGIGIVVFVVSISSIYNLRAYFIAWPHNTATQLTFRIHP